MQSETGLALVYLSFFIVMYREGLSSAVLVIGFSIGTLVVATLLVEKNSLAIILTGNYSVYYFYYATPGKKKQDTSCQYRSYMDYCV